MANRAEPLQFDPSRYHKDCVDILRAKCWLSFLEKHSGHNKQTAKEFVSSFNGERAVVGNLSFRVSEDTIAQAIGIILEGEKYFKTKQFKEKRWAPFISRSRLSAVHWKSGILRS